MNLLRQITEMAGKNCSITVMSYSVTDGWLRQLGKLRRDFDVRKVTIVLDRNVMIRHRQLLLQLETTADEIYLSDSHAKMYLAQSEKYEVAVITSANATNNYRNECYYATDRRSELEQLRTDLRGILGTAYRIK